MIPFWALALIAGSAIVTVVFMLVARWLSPEGLLRDSVPAAAVFGVLGVAFAVLLAFVMFLAFENYVRAHEGASREAVAISQLARITRLFPAPQSEELHDDLGCYARAVISDEWPQMQQGLQSNVVEGWIARIETTVNEMPINDAKTQISLSHWLDEMAVRREGRRARLAEATPTIPAAVWLMLILGAFLTVAYIVVFADRRERWWTLAVMSGSIAALIASGLLVVSFLDRPYLEDGAYIAPTEMQTTLRFIEDEIAGFPGTRLPCDLQGHPDLS